MSIFEITAAGLRLTRCQPGGRRNLLGLWFLAVHYEIMENLQHPHKLV